MADKVLYIVRGVSGAGKTSLAKSIVGDSNYFEADHFFEDEDGNYNFNAGMIGEAHRCNRQVVELAMLTGTTPLAVSNTFTRLWEFKEFMDLAKQYEYTCFVITVENYHGCASIHAVPTDKITEMVERYELKLV